MNGSDPGFVSALKRLTRTMVLAPGAMARFGLEQAESLSALLALVPSGRTAGPGASSDVGGAGAGMKEDQQDLIPSLADLQRSWANACSRPFGPDSRLLSALMLRTLQLTAELNKHFPGQRGTWQEFENRVQAFGSFQHADLILDLVVDDNNHLESWIERAGSLSPYSRLWVIEGLGYAAGQVGPKGDRGRERCPLKGDSFAAPERYWIPLHTGLGVSLAAQALAQDSAALPAALEGFLEQCDRHSRSGFRQATFEALGLVARQFHAHQLSDFERPLMAQDPILASLFWHGVGRALYFVPSHALPYSGSRARALGKALREPPHELGRLNAVAGLSWALTLVNIRHPEILEGFLEGSMDSLCSSEAFSHGVSSAIVIWFDAMGEDLHLRRFLDHLPRASNPELAHIWERRVRRPCLEALESYPVLRESRRLDELFCYRPPRGC